MNIIEGLNIKGFKLNTAENFASIPGLLHWFDARLRVTTTVSGSNLRVTSWGSLAGEGVEVLTPSVNSRRPFRDNNYSITFRQIGSTIAIANSTSSNLHKYDSSFHVPFTFGAYMIMSYDLSGGAIGAARSYQMGQTNGNNFIGPMVVLNSSGEPVFTAPRNIVRSNGGSLVGNIESTIPYTYNVPFNYAEIRSYNVHQQSFELDSGYQVVRNQTNVAVSPENTTGNTTNVAISRGGTGDGFFNVHAFIMYDWRDFSHSQILEFDSRVKAILTPLRQEFVTLSTP
jgi:hypothetical protein